MSGSEPPAQAAVREVAEEVGLRVSSYRFLWSVPYPSGPTMVYAVDCDDAEPRLGIDPDLTCDCPRMVGLDWIDLAVSTETGTLAIPTMLLAAPAVVRALPGWRP